MRSIVTCFRCKTFPPSCTSSRGVNNKHTRELGDECRQNWVSAPGEIPREVILHATRLKVNPAPLQATDYRKWSSCGSVFITTLQSGKLATQLAVSLLAGALMSASSSFHSAPSWKKDKFVPSSLAFCFCGVFSLISVVGDTFVTVCPWKITQLDETVRS